MREKIRYLILYSEITTLDLKIISNLAFSDIPFIAIDARGSSNDVTIGYLYQVSDYVLRYARIIIDDPAATGDRQEVITINGTDSPGNPIQNAVPVNSTAGAGYPDTEVPAQGSIMPAGGGNGMKTIWIEFKDNAGNIQTQHAFTTINYANTTLSFDIAYYADAGLTNSLGQNPFLKTGNYYLKITANQDLQDSPDIQIDAEGTSNDVASGPITMINPRIFYYTRTIAFDDAATGGIPVLTTGIWRGDIIRIEGEVKVYKADVIPGRTYTVYWDDDSEGTGYYYGDIKVSAYREDLYTPYFVDEDKGYTTPRFITARESILYLRAGGYFPYTSGNFRLKVAAAEPAISIKPGQEKH